MLRYAALIAFCALLTVIGLVGGWYAARQGMSGGAPADPHAADAPDGAAAQALDDRTLANMGVTIGPAKRSTFTRTRSVQAIVEDRPHNLQPVVSPLGGIVTQVHVDEGGAADAGAELVVLVRDPVARPKPDLTADVLKPISEEVHTSVAELRKAIGRRAIVDANLQRVLEARKGRDGSSFPILRKSEIEYQNERAEIELHIDAARRELARHGLTDKDIARVEAGKRPPANADLWEHALEHHGLWPKTADTIRASLPEADRGRPWSIAAIGELAAHGLATGDLARCLVDDPRMASHFAEVAGLLIEGMPLDTVKTLAAAGALEPSTVLRAPKSVERWDVQRVAVRPGSRVEAGHALVTLHDARMMWLRLDPVGAEIGHVVRALAAGTPLEAVPLVPESGPVLQDLRLSRMATFGTETEGGGRAYAEAKNSRLCPAGQSTACSWQLRVGLRYVVKVPVQRLEGRFVFPVGAVTNEGPNRIVYVKEGRSFRAQTVTVEFEDDEVTVVKDDGGIFEDDPVALSGAFALGLALQSDKVDPSMEHGHAH